MSVKKWRIGTSGWSYKHWEGRFYPYGLKAAEWLPYYCDRFDTVEVNSSFYRLPFKGMITGWLKKTPPDFGFVIKGSRRVTHFLKLHNIQEPLKALFERLEPLREKILCILWQLPPSMKLDLASLEGFLRQLPDTYRYAIEFRHASWIEKCTFQLLERYQSAHCILSAPGLPCNTAITTDFAYIRFHGINRWYNYEYTQDDLFWWRDQIQRIGESVERVLAYFNNDFDAYAVNNALSLKDLLENS
ncbi:DUF72 domain-containing protein [bacterium]|nr:DUF72 domain-containing protein [bacterium]